LARQQSGIDVFSYFADKFADDPVRIEPERIPF
jgi:hypothetical protein